MARGKKNAFLENYVEGKPLKILRSAKSEQKVPVTDERNGVCFDRKAATTTLEGKWLVVYQKRSGAQVVRQWFDRLEDAMLAYRLLTKAKNVQVVTGVH